MKNGTIAQFGKPLKTVFCLFNRFYTRLKPGANEKPANGVVMAMKYGMLNNNNL
jgi:hypothetical protein